jgi:hypothetical protein
MTSSAFVHLPNVIVRCINDCGGYLAVQDGRYARVDSQEDATRFTSDTKAWQATMAAGWGNVPPPNHVPHDIPFGVSRTLRCDGRGAGDCAEARAYRETIVCLICRVKGWRLPPDDPSGQRA